MPIETIRADWEAPKHVQAFNTTRLGGVSQAPYDSLNLGLHVNDDSDAVKENRNRLMLSEAVPAMPHWLRQVHGCDVLTVPVGGCGDKSLKTSAQLSDKDLTNDSNTPCEADAAFTDEINQVLCVVTADCLPVVVTNDAGTKLAVAHAGWKGLANGVLEACLKKFSADEPLHVWLGPAIGPKAFEVGNEVMDAFASVDAAQQACFAEHPDTDDKKYADIYALARRIIERSRSADAGECCITGGQFCTVTDVTRFHSYRRDGANSGRMALMAWLSPQA